MPEKQYFKNKKTWKQISTNVPPQMYQALKKQVTKDRTMSHVLRELIAESEVMKAGMPRPSWSVDMANELAEMRKELAELKAMQPTAQTRTKSTSESSYSWVQPNQKYPAWRPPNLEAALPAPEEPESSKPKPQYESAPDLDDLFDFFPASDPVEEQTEPQEAAAETEPAVFADLAQEPQSRPRPFSFLSKLTDMLGVRKTA